jgi:hypothetical protein
MAGPSDNLGRAVIQLTAENRQLKAKLAESEASLRAYGDTAVRQNSRVQASFGATTTGIKSSIRAVTSFVGALGAAVGTATLMFRLGQHIGTAFESSASKIDRAIDSIDMSEATKTLADYEARLEAVNQRLDNKQNGDFGQRLFAEWEELFHGESEDLKKTLDDRIRSVREQIAQQKRLEEDSKFIAKFNAAIDRLEAIQQQQTGPFGAGQVATLEAIRGVLEQIASQGRRF